MCHIFEWVFRKAVHTWLLTNVAECFRHQMMLRRCYEMGDGGLGGRLEVADAVKLGESCDLLCGETNRWARDLMNMLLTIVSFRIS